MAKKKFEELNAAFNQQVSVAAEQLKAIAAEQDETRNAALTKAYFAQREAVNKIAIQLLVGAEIYANKKGEEKIKFNQSLPTLMQINEIATVMDLLVNSENDVFGKEDDDMQIPGFQIPVIEKVSNKKLGSAIIGTNAPSIANIYFGGTDCIKIAALGQEARKRANLIKFIIVAGSVVVVAGGVTAAAIVISKKKNKADEITDVDVVVDEGTDEVPEVVELDSLREAISF